MNEFMSGKFFVPIAIITTILAFVLFGIVLNTSLRAMVKIDLYSSSLINHTTGKTDVYIGYCSIDNNENGSYLLECNLRNSEEISIPGKVFSRTLNKDHEYTLTVERLN
jgi:hypothetical protein